MADDGKTPKTDRSCGSCSLCYKLVAIVALNKPMNRWCPHCLKQRGCSIYESRPEECRTFNCEWLTHTDIGDEWYPVRSKMVLHRVMDGNISKLIVHVDSGSPLAWKKEPYYGHLKRWAKNIEAQNGMINLYVGNRLIVVLPNKEIDLGEMKIGDKINMRKWRVGSGWEYEFEKESGDP